LAKAKGLFLFKASVRATAIAVLVILVGFALLGVYWPGLHGQFFFDDFPNILAVGNVRLETLSIESLSAAVGSGGSGPSGRPVAQLSFALNHYFGGLDPFAFKLTNLAIHLANGVLIFILALRLFASFSVSLKQRRASIAAGVLASAWLLHPIQLLPVLHVVQRMTSLSAFFLLMALLCHIRWREVGASRSAGWLLLGWGIFWPLSFLSKETGLLFPFFALAWELIVRRAVFGGLDRIARVFAALAGVALALVVGYLLSPLGDWLWAGYGLRDFSLTERLLSEGRVLWFYLGLILFPRLEAFGLFHDDFTISTGLLTPWATLPAFAGLLALVWVSWWMRKRMPLVSFGIAWFMIGHAMESTFLPLEIAHEHRNYLPLFGILLAVVSVLVRTLEKTGPAKTLGIALMATMLVYFPFVTALRADQFGDEVRRSQIEAQHHRGSARAQHEAGRVLAGLEGSDSASSPRYSLARAHYELAGQLDPNFKMNLLGLIHLNCQAGIPVEQQWVGELQRRLRETPFAPGDRTVLYSLKEMTVAGSVCLGRSEVDGLFAAAITNPGVSLGVQAMLYSWHADYLWLHEKDLAAAFAALSQSLTLVPSNASNRLKLAQLRFIAGERDQAHQLVLELRGERLSLEERKTLDELLAGLGMLESKPASEKTDQ
jgi:protein O-mannosyl-transferase